MALQVAEGAVVGHQLEAVVRALEGAPGPVPSVAPIADVRGQQCDPVVVAELADPTGRLPLAAAEVRETGRHQDLLFPVRIEVEEHHLGLTARRRGRRCLERSQFGPQARHEPRRAVTRGREVVGPLAAAGGNVDTLEERGYDLAQLFEHEVRVVTGFGERVRAHAQQQLLVGLAGPINPDVGERRRREQAAQCVE